MIELTPLTRTHIATLFRAADVNDAERLVAHECADNLPLNSDGATPAGLERIRFAAIRVSGGSLDRLRDAVGLAQTDWRDLLVAADFALHVDAHERWQPRRLDAALQTEWMAGQRPHGVTFERRHRVRMLTGRRQGKSGTVIALIGLEPEPTYRVELVGSGEQIEVSQRMLASAV